MQESNTSVSHFKVKGHPQNGLKVNIRTKLNKRVMDVAQTADHGHNAGQLILYDSYGSANQQFYIIQQGPDYLIKCVHSDKVLQVQNASHEDGAKIIQSNYNGSPSQKWRLQQLSPDSGNFYIYSSNSGKVLDVTQQKGQNHVNIIQYTFNGNKNQIWNFKTI